MQIKNLMGSGLCLILILINISCGSVSVTAASGDNTVDTSTSATPTNTGSVGNTTYIFASDYQSSGQLYVATLLNGVSRLLNTGVTLLGTEARILFYQNLLYVLHAGASFNSVSSDNLQIIDPFDSTSSYRTLGQYSTGVATNPTDVVIDGTRAFISLYDPTNDSSNTNVHGQPGDVIEMDTNTGDILKRYSFFDFLSNDGDRNAHAYRLLLKDNILYVILQDLTSGTFASTSNGLIGMININTQQVLGVIELTGRNPSSLALSSDGNTLFVGSTDDFSSSTAYGGIDVIDLVNQVAVDFISDNTLGGYIESLVRHGTDIFAVAATYNTATFTFLSKILKFDEGIDAPSDVTTFKTYSTDIRSIFVQDNLLWVSYRVISTTDGDSNPAIRIFNTETGVQQGATLTPVVAGISIAGEL